MYITNHAVARFRERFGARTICQANDEAIRGYLLHHYKKSREVVPLQPSKEDHRVAGKLVFVTHDQKVLTVFRFKPERYKPKRLRHYYPNKQGRKVR